MCLQMCGHTVVAPWVEQLDPTLKLKGSLWLDANDASDSGGDQLQLIACG